MSELALDDELVYEYLAECREHLATIESDLLAIEVAGSEIEEQVVNRVFRAAHSIKGGAGFFDLVRIRELAHAAESVLDLIRSRRLVATPEMVNVLLLAFDKLSGMIEDHVHSNSADIGDCVAALTLLSEHGLPEQKKLKLPDERITEHGRFSEVSALDLDQASRTGKHIYVVEFDLLADIQRRGKNALDVFRLLMNCGQILDSALDLDSVGTLEDEPSHTIRLAFLYASPLDPFALSQLLSVPEAQIRTVAQPAPVSPVTAAAPVSASVSIPEPSSESLSHPEGSSSAPPEATLRLNVSLLDSLMTLAGELVLSRNQLNEAVANRDERALSFSASRISAVTSELQEAITLTRMQPVGSIFAKFPRLVRDLARDLGKDVQLRLEGGDVELDKAILEGLSDPLTHMVRNSVDHGIEMSQTRVAGGKAACGTITLRASHQAGQVVLEVGDDGKGLVPARIAASAVAKELIAAEQANSMTDREKMELIFLPGLSTADRISSVSGRGVGMDVVKTNLDRLGGKIEIDSVAGKGSTFRIKLPLTLAIIPSLLVSESGCRFAIPQVSVGELVRIPAAKAAQRIDRVGGADVLALRDRLLPLVHLADVLGVPRSTEARAVNVIQVDTGAFQYGLVVEQLHDTFEIVVKPLGRHVKGLRDYAGATILGNGEVALILDPAGLAERAQLKPNGETPAEEAEFTAELHSLLVFRNAPEEVCAIPIELVTRVEKLDPCRIEYLAGKRTIPYEGNSMPLAMLKDTAEVGEPGSDQQWVLIVIECAGRTLGLVGAEPVDMVDAALTLDTVTLRQPGIAGSAILNGKTTLMIDVYELARSIPGMGAELSEAAGGSGPTGDRPTILLAEDSDFFRNQLQQLVEAVGYKAITACDGQSAWELLQEHAHEVAVVATDIEMPRMDGLALTRQIRSDPRFATLPVIALSSLAGEEEVARGMAAGVSEYQVKLDRDLLIETIRRSLHT